MTAVPAQVAGVKEIAVAVPPTDFGGYNTDLLAACHELGITEVYRMGGRRALPPWLTAWKGSSGSTKLSVPEICSSRWPNGLCMGKSTSTASPARAKWSCWPTRPHGPISSPADLISQAEHSPGSSVLITWHRPLIDAVKEALASQLARLARGELARASLEEYGALIAARDANEAAELCDLLAPEHLHISTANPEEILAKVQNAGAIFLGHHTPVAVGDYVAGPSHVLPTGGTARFANGLCANDFLKRSSVIHYNREALAAGADDIRRMAAKEGLTAHSASVDIRLADRS